MPRQFNVPQLVDRVLANERPGLAEAITLVESTLPAHRPLARQLLGELLPHSGGALRVGLTGVPGAGKSTFVDAMGRRLIDKGHKVAVLAVDPSSTRTGGSILGDRTRMGELAERDEAFIRPSPSAGHLGGVARATREAMIIVEAAGYDTVLIETVGVGQSEVAVAGMVDTFLMLALTGSGDQLQGIKRGILELADVIGVNKADGDNKAQARVTARDLSIAMKLITDESEGHRTPVLTCSSYSGEGLDELWQAVVDHRDWIDESIGLARYRADQQVSWMWSQIESSVIDSLHSTPQLLQLGHQLEHGVEDQTVSALEASTQFLAAYAQAVPDFDWK